MIVYGDFSQGHNFNTFLERREDSMKELRCSSKRDLYLHKVSLILVIAIFISLINVPYVFAASGYEVNYTELADWGTGFVGSIEIVNNGDKEIDQWRIEFDWNQCISSIWNAKVESYTDGHYTINCEAWNKVIPAGGKIIFGFLGIPKQNESEPLNFVVKDIYTDLAQKDGQWQNYLLGIQGAAFQKSFAEGLVVASTSFEANEPYRIGYEIIEKNPVERFIQAKYQNVDIPTTDGIKLKGIFFPAKSPKGTIIMLHGRGSTALWEVPKLKFLLDNGYQILAYNSRCWNYYSTPEKYIGLINNDLNDIGSAIDYLKSRYDVDKNKIGIYGFSYGANKALMEAAVRNDVKVLVSDGASQNIPTYSSYFTWEVIGRDFFKIYEEKYGADALSYPINFFPSVYTNAVAAINKPILFIHGLNDTLVPVEDVNVLFDAANEPKDKLI